MSSSAVLHTIELQENVARLPNSPGMIELTDEDLAQVAGTDGQYMEHMRHMCKEYCECPCDRRIRFSLTRLHIEYRLDFLHYHLSVN